MLRFWLVCFVILFVMVEFWQWLRELTIALPLCIIGGIALANLKAVSPTPSRSDHLTLPPERSDSPQQ